MKPIDPTGAPGRATTFGKDQPEFVPLPARVEDGCVVHTRWHLSLDERRAILDGADIDLQLITGGRPLQPIHITVQGVEEPTANEDGEVPA